MIDSLVDTSDASTIIVPNNMCISELVQYPIL